MLTGTGLEEEVLRGEQGALLHRHRSVDAGSQLCSSGVVLVFGKLGAEDLDDVEDLVPKNAKKMGDSSICI